MAPLNVSFNESSSVQYILETSLAASSDKKAYSLIWQLFHLKMSLMLGVFHTVFSMLDA